MSASNTPIKVVSLPEPLHAFLSEVMNRVVQEGLLVPDELGYAAALWDRIRMAQTVAPPTPEQAEPAAEDPEA